MLKSGLDNMDLTKYLISQVTQSPEDRLEALKEYMPSAELADWKLEIAGQRVQVIKKDPVHGGVLEFGTEIVASQDGTIAALLGASPGASTAAAGSGSGAPGRADSAALLAPTLVLAAARVLSISLSRGR